LRPGGRVGLTDVVVERTLPAELAGVAGWLACIADALPAWGYVSLLEEAGLRVRRAERRDAALERMIDQIEARLRVLGMTASDRLAEAGVDADAALPYLESARRALVEGRVGYVLVTAEKPPA
ncbi:methyltransferase type 11, partial [Streptomonospora algeriensis]